MGGILGALCAGPFGHQTPSTVEKLGPEAHLCQGQAGNTQVLACVPKPSTELHSNIVSLKTTSFYKGTMRGMNILVSNLFSVVLTTGHNLC